MAGCLPNIWLSPTGGFEVGCSSTEGGIRLHKSISSQCARFDEIANFMKVLEEIFRIENLI